MADREALLARSPLFEHLDDEAIRALANQLAEVRLPAGRVLFEDGDPGDSAYLVLRGRVRIILSNASGVTTTLATLGPGQLFGEVSLLDGGPRTAGAIASEDTDLLVIDRDDLLEILVHRPSAALDLLAVMGRRLRESNARLRPGPRRRAPGRNPADAMAAALGSRPFLLVPLALLGWWAAAAGGAGWPASLLNTAAPVMAALAIVIVQVTTLLAHSLRREEAQGQQAQSLDDALARILHARAVG